MLLIQVFRHFEINLHLKLYTCYVQRMEVNLGLLAFMQVGHVGACHLASYSFFQKTMQCIIDRTCNCQRVLITSSLVQKPLWKHSTRMYLEDLRIVGAQKKRNQGNKFSDQQHTPSHTFPQQGSSPFCLRVYVVCSYSQIYHLEIR